MRKRPTLSTAVFESLFDTLVPRPFLRRIVRQFGPAQRRPPKVAATDLIMGLVFHVLAGSGTLAHHVKELTDQDISDAALAQRRGRLQGRIFQEILKESLRPRAQQKAHPEAFYHGLRLCGIDGSSMSVSNAPRMAEGMTKAKSRRFKAAFAKLGVAALVELGIRNPIAATIGIAGESEMVLSCQLLEQLSEKSLLLADRYYGAPKLLVELRRLHPEGQREFLVRVKRNIKRRLLESYADGSALVEIVSEKTKMIVREIIGQVRKGAGKWSEVRLWTSLLDWRKHPANELIALYAHRWEQETFYRELKVDMRSSKVLRSQTPETAAQEVTALILGYAMLVDERIKAAEEGEVPVLRISFLKTFEAIRGLWQFLEVTEGIIDERGVRLAVRRTLKMIAARALPKRRQRSCPRAVRQPVSSWPRLLKNTSNNGSATYNITPITA